jgi:hypothetical protein
MQDRTELRLCVNSPHTRPPGQAGKTGIKTADHGADCAHIDKKSRPRSRAVDIPVCGEWRIADFRHKSAIRHTHVTSSDEDQFVQTLPECPSSVPLFALNFRKNQFSLVSRPRKGASKAADFPIAGLSSSPSQALHILSPGRLQLPRAPSPKVPAYPAHRRGGGDSSHGRDRATRSPSCTVDATRWR